MKHLVITIVSGQWFATLNGKHLTPEQTQKAIMDGATYEFKS